MPGVPALPAHGKTAITLDDLVALNDELRALVRAGIPLEKGLRSLGQDLPGRLGTLARSLGERLERVESFVDVLAERSDQFPRAYRAVVAAGVRSGHLPAALEGISTAARRAADLRRVMIVSLIYPVAVLVLASGIFLLTATKLSPMVTRFYQELTRGDIPWWYRQLNRVVEVGPQALLVFWCVLIVSAGWWFYRSSLATALNTDRRRGLPTVTRVLHAGRMATFADVLAMMVDHRVPLDEAVVLASEASGDRLLTNSCSALAQRVRSGGQTVALPKGLPPLLGWLIVAGVRQDQLAKTLRQTAASYRRRAKTMGNWLTVYLPILLSAGIGGAIVALYAFLVMAPFFDLLYRLSAP